MECKEVKKEEITDTSWERFETIDCFIFKGFPDNVMMRLDEGYIRLDSGELESNPINTSMTALRVDAVCEYIIRPWV